MFFGIAEIAFHTMGKEQHLTRQCHLTRGHLLEKSGTDFKENTKSDSKGVAEDRELIYTSV